MFWKAVQIASNYFAFHMHFNNISQFISIFLPELAFFRDGVIFNGLWLSDYESSLSDKIFFTNPVASNSRLGDILPAKRNTYSKPKFPRPTTDMTNFPPLIDLLQSCIFPLNFFLSRILEAKKGSSRILLTLCPNLYKIRYNLEFFLQISNGHHVSCIPFAGCFRDHCQVGTLMTSSITFHTTKTTSSLIHSSMG